MESMTSRERVLKAINHQEADRMPIDIGMHLSTGISAFAYWNLREYLGLPVKSVDVPDMNQFLARVEDDILERFHCDCKMLWPKWDNPHIWNPRSKYRFSIPETAKPYLDKNKSWVIKRGGEKLLMPASGFFFSNGWGDYFDFNEDELIGANAREAEKIYKETEYFTTLLQSFYGYFNSTDPDWLCKMITDPKDILEENSKKCEKEIIKAGKVIKSMGKYIQAVCINSDLGMQGGPICRPSLYRDLCAPFIKKLCDFLHQNSDIKVFMHSCGSIKTFIPILIECGIDVLNPIQIFADEMDPKDLKKEFGNKITFWGGGCDTQRVLPAGTTEEICDHVRENINIFKPGGGYVFNQVHNIMGDIEPEKVIAMYDIAYEDSFYSIAEEKDQS